VNKISEIFQAWVAAANPTSEQHALAEYRSSICDSCDRKTHVPAFNILVCSECGCPLNKKVFSPRGPEACPLAKWEK
jgi:hypothetical protein